MNSFWGRIAIGIVVGVVIGVIVGSINGLMNGPGWLTGAIIGGLAPAVLLAIRTRTQK